MMHARHVTMSEEEDGAMPRTPGTLRRSAASSGTKQTLKKDPLRGSQHSETTTGTKQKRRNSAHSNKSLNSHGSGGNNGFQYGDDSFAGSHRVHGSQNSLHGSQTFNHSVQQFQTSYLNSGSSVASRQSQATEFTATPNTTRGSIVRRKVPSTPGSQLSASTRRSNPQTPPGGTSPPGGNGRRKIKKKPSDDTHGTERSSSTRTSFVTANTANSSFSFNDAHFSSDDGECDGVRPKGSPGKKRRPKVTGEPVTPVRRSTSIVMSPSSPQVTGLTNSGGSSGESPVPSSPSKGGRRLVKKKKPRKPDEPESQRRVRPTTTTRRGGENEDDNGHFYSGAEELDHLTTDDEEYAMAPRQNHRPIRRTAKKKGPMRNSVNYQISPDEVPETPMSQRQVPATIGRTPMRSASTSSTPDDEFRVAPSRRTSFDTAFTQTSTFTSASITTKLYEHARRCQWDEVMREVEANPRDAKTVGDKDGTTALHLAVMSRTNPMMRDGRVGEFKPAPLELIEMLVKACPEAASTRCSRKRYTPLAYACLVADHGYDMDDCSEMVLILLKYAPGSVFVFTDDGFSAVDIHILSYSQIHKQKEEVYSGGRTSTVVLRTLLAEQPDLAESRVYKHKVRGPIELLYRCNTSEFQDAMIDDLTGDPSDAKKKQLKSRFGSVASVLSDWWAWKWVLLLLKFSTIKDKKPGTIFSAVQAAARLVACPLPILALAINTFPHQVEERDPRGDIYNLPLHEICSWRADEAIISGDPFVAGRKLKAIQLLLNEYPDAARMTNNMGETPLQLAVETCTPWHGGLELLVESCPKALKFPRKLRMGDQGLCLSVLNPSALDSVASYDSDEEDPMSAMEGMYPFVLSAVLGGVAKNKRRVPFDYTEEQKEQHMQHLLQKDLQAVRSVYGLLRSRPDVLEKYRKDVTRDYLRMLREQEDD